MSIEAASPAIDTRHRKTYFFHMTWVRRIITAVLTLLLKLVIDIQSYGIEHMPSAGPVVLAANHLTNFDVFPMQIVLPRLIFFMGKEELFRSPAVDWVLRHLGAFPVRRGGPDEWALQHAAEILEKGLVLGIFPEGKRSKGTGLRPAKTGAARLAIAAGCPIVPVAVHGTQYVFRRFPFRTQVRIILGKPIYPHEGETALALTDRLMFTLADMLPPEARGVYARRPHGF